MKQAKEISFLLSPITFRKVLLSFYVFCFFVILFMFWNMWVSYIIIYILVFTTFHRTSWPDDLSRGGSSRRAAGLQPSLKNVRQKIPPNGQTRLKFGFSHENFKTQSFSVLPTISAQRFLGIQQNQCFAACQRHRLCDDVFSTLADEFGDFGAVIRTALKERNQTIGCKKHGGISAYRKAFLIFWWWIFKEKTKEIWPWLFFTTWISWSAFASTLAILAALDSNLTANLGLRKYSPSFICTSAACDCRLSWWAF